ncbi:MAG TPA: PD-(D/E)XK nuclease family protein, partial [Chloroflexota bacterium]
PGESVVDAYYYSLTKAEKLSVAASDETALAALVERVKGHLRAGSYPVTPDVDQKACDYCPYDSVCRRGPRLLRKRAAAP